MYKYIRIHNGNIGTHSTAVLEFWHSTGFNTEWDALKHLVGCLWTGWFNESSSLGNECCKEYSNSNFKFCPMCGYEIDNSRIISGFELFLHSLISSTANDVGFIWFHYLNTAGWNDYEEEDNFLPFIFTKDETIFVNEYGASVLFAVWAGGDDPQLQKQFKSYHYFDKGLVNLTKYQDNEEG